MVEWRPVCARVREVVVNVHMHVMKFSMLENRT